MKSTTGVKVLFLCSMLSLQQVSAAVPGSASGDVDSSFSGVAKQLQVAPQTYLQQCIFAQEIGNAIRAFDATHGRLPQTTSELILSKYLFTTLRQPDGTGCPLVATPAPWSYYLELSGGVRHWQLQRTFATTLNMVHEPIADAVIGMPPAVRHRGMPAAAAASLLRDSNPRPTAPSPLATFPWDAAQYLERSGEPGDARVRAYRSSAQFQIQCFLELKGRLPQSWGELQTVLDITNLAGCPFDERPLLGDWATSEAGVVVMRDAAGDHFRIIQKSTAAAIDQDVYRVNKGAKRGTSPFTWVFMDEAMIAEIPWQPLLSVSSGT